MQRSVILFALALLGITATSPGQPVITQQPANQPVILGAKVTIQVSAQGITPLGYQWRFNAANLPGATNSNLSLANVQWTNAGSYAVAVMDSSGSITSRVARLDIIPGFTRITTESIGTDVHESAGAAWMDYEGDGYLGLVVANGVDGTGDRNSLYRNNGDGTFTKVTTDPVASILGTSLTVVWGDYDNDGAPDLFCANWPAAPGTAGGFLFHNQGGGTFTPITNSELVAVRGRFAAVWGDYDNDGFLDIFLANTGGTNFLFHNNGDGTFAAAQVPMSAPHPSGGKGANGAAWADYDNDGKLDLLLTSGSGHNALFHNNGDGTFTQVRGAPFDTDVAATVGAAWGDYDNDGYLDLFLANGNFDSGMYRNYLYHNNGDGTFTKVTTGSIVTDTGASVTAAWEDFDNDGYLDLYVSHATGGTGFQANALYHNNGDGTFTRVTTGALVASGSDSGGVAWGDYDNDGFPDLFVAGEGQPSTLYHNGGNSNSWITIKLIGTVSNRSAIGAKVRVKASTRGEPQWQMRQITNGDGLAGSSLNPHFGLGAATNIDTVRIEWPSGTIQQFQNVSPKQMLTVIEPPRLLASAVKGAPEFSIKGGRGMQYEIETSGDLRTWSPVGSVTITNLDGTARLVDNSPATGERFFRAVSP